MKASRMNQKQIVRTKHFNQMRIRRWIQKSICEGIGFVRVIREATRPFIALCFLSFVFGSSTLSADRYWDTTAGLGNGVGGSGTWGTTFSTTPTGDAALTTAATTDAAIFQGTAGIITLDLGQTASSLTFNTTNYTITGSNSTARVLSGPISLGSNVNLRIGNGETTNITIGVGSVSGSTGSSLTINGSGTGTTVTRLNLSNSGSTISVPINIAGTGVANIASIATGTRCRETLLAMDLN